MKQEMKITVCFGPTKIVVPCGTQLPVRELIQQAVLRYKKVTNKHADDHIRVQCLQTCEEEAILDEDDLVGDVLDDKDKVTASYEENLVSRPGHNGGDGTSTSSVGTASPDIFQGEIAHLPAEGIPLSKTVGGQKKTMTDEHKSTSSSVKYVDSFSPISSLSSSMTSEGQSKARRHLEGRSTSSDTEGYLDHNGENCNEENGNGVSAFKREPARKSLKSDHLDRWIDIQESYYEHERHEPTGASFSPDDKYNASDLASMFGRQVSLSFSEMEDTEHVNIILKPTMGENLGITVQGYKTADGRELGLIVFQIDPKSCAARDGRVQVADRIVTVNSQDLTNMSNERAEEAFNKALQCGSIELGISRSHSFVPGEHDAVKSKRTRSVASSKDGSEAEQVEEEERNTLAPLPHFNNTSALDALTSKGKLNDMVPRIVEKRMSIELIKGSDGLGFSVTSRDNAAGGSSPIYIKNILPYGAAIKDGRLQAGDQIIQVDGKEMTGKNQEQAVTILRRTTGQVRLEIQRKVTVTSPVGSNKLMKDLERAPSDNRGNKILTYRIQLPSTGTAGLGITVKGKSSVVEPNESGDDRGIFIKSIVQGGAAQMDGRLRPDDQLISVNGVKLTGMSNSSAMKTLRSAMEASCTLVSVEVSVIRSVNEIRNSVSELESTKHNVDRAIDVGMNGIQHSFKEDEEMDVTDSTPTQEGRLTRVEKSVDQGNAVPEVMLSHNRPSLGEENLNKRSLHEAIIEDELPELPCRRKLPLDDELPELKSARKTATKLGSSSVHRNPSYYIAMNRSGPRERHSKGKRPMKKSPFYQPKGESSSQKNEEINATARPAKHEKPQKVIASYIDVVPTPTRAFCVASRPTSTVAEPTPPMSTTAPLTLSSRSLEAKLDQTRHRSASSSSTSEPSTPRSKNPPTSLTIPKGTPPPPPPRTSRPSPYAKQFPNYLAGNALALRKSNSANSSEYSEPGDQAPSSVQSSRSNTSEVKVISATEVTQRTKKETHGCSEAREQHNVKVEERQHHSLTDDEGDNQESFLREGFGRQSMSEKRFKLVQTDITQTEFYKQRVTRSRSLEGTNQLTNASPVVNDIQAQTLPRLSSTSPEKRKKRKSKEHREKHSESSKSSKERGKDTNRVKDRAIEPSHTQRGQWRTSSDGAVKKYGGHSHVIRASPLVTSEDNGPEYSAVHPEPSVDEIPITMQSNADFRSIHPKAKKKQFNLKVLGQALKPKAHKGKYDMFRQTPESPSEPNIEFMDEQRYRQLLAGEKNRERSASETVFGSQFWDVEDGRSSSRRRKDEPSKRPSPPTLQEFIRKGSGEYTITESAQI